MRHIPLALLSLLPAAAWAHPNSDDHAHGTGFVDGLLHPLGGADHLAAMVAVGLWAALTGGRALWAYPLAFVAAMVLAGLAGVGQAPLPGMEQAILASVIVVGAAAALALRPPMAAALAALALFGAAHGYAHGVEGLAGAGYPAGFTLATLALHAVGLVIGLMAMHVQRPVITRGAAAITAIAGAWMALT
ncbi:MAG: urease accessory protein UreJ [Rhodobacteraceae bacterium HLUCCA12]|nr:MAG: urease accessory protein UreJ [Rhodobacteraceae bacterium HLUCCA12]